MAATNIQIVQEDGLYYVYRGRHLVALSRGTRHLGIAQREAQRIAAKPYRLLRRGGRYYPQYQELNKWWSMWESAQAQKPASFVSLDAAKRFFAKWDIEGYSIEG